MSEVPASAKVEAIRDSLLRQGVLIGVGGVYGNVIRFQPPLIITKQQIAIRRLLRSRSHYRK